MHQPGMQIVWLLVCLPAGMLGCVAQLSRVCRHGPRLTIHYCVMPESSASSVFCPHVVGCTQAWVVLQLVNEEKGCMAAWYFVTGLCPTGSVVCELVDPFLSLAAVPSVCFAGGDMCGLSCLSVLPLCVSGHSPCQRVSFWGGLLLYMLAYVGV